MGLNSLCGKCAFDGGKKNALATGHSVVYWCHGGFSHRVKLFYLWSKPGIEL